MLAEKLAEGRRGEQWLAPEVTMRLRKSGRRDLNPRPPEPHSGALPDCATSRRARRVDAQTPRRAGKTTTATMCRRQRVTAHASVLRLVPSLTRPPEHSHQLCLLVALSTRSLSTADLVGKRDGKGHIMVHLRCGFTRRPGVELRPRNVVFQLQPHHDPRPTEGLHASVQQERR
jgi:hypothetical protein